MHKQKIYIFDSPDGTGKTEIGKEMSRRTAIPYFKMTTEHENWRNGSFKEALRFDQTYISEFLKQTGQSVIIDRAYPAEWVYSKVFNRDTDDATLLKVDSAFADLGTVIIIPLRRNYQNSREDEVVPKEKLQDLHNAYVSFGEWTSCKVLYIYVDDFNNNLRSELDAIYLGLNQLDHFGSRVFRLYDESKGAIR